MCYNKIMKNIFKVLLAVILFVPLKASAITFNVLVLPADILNACNNYYCYDEVSNIVAEDVIENFSASNAIQAPSLDLVRAKLNSNPALKSTTINTLRKYNKAGNLDMAAIKNISNEFSAKSVLLISSSAMTRKSNLRRSVWEVLDLASGFNIVYPFELETNAVLIDTVNGLVMWSGNFTKKLGNNNNEFQAKSPSQASAKLEQMRLYSKAIAAKSISQNVTLRFFPKTSNPVVSPKSMENASPSAFFRMNTPIPGIDMKNSDIKGVNESDFGEIIYGL